MVVFKWASLAIKIVKVENAFVNLKNLLWYMRFL